MRGLSTSGARWRSAAGAMLAVFFLTALEAVPVAAVPPSWKDAVAGIEANRDQAVATLFDLIEMYEDYLAAEPSAAAATQELTAIVTDMEEVAAAAGDEIRSIMVEHRTYPQVQNVGSRALDMITTTETYAIAVTTLRHDDYVEVLLPPVIPPPTTTTTLPAVVTTTTGPVTTTTTPPAISTTTTTTQLPASTTTTTTTAPAGVAGPGEPPSLPGDAGTTSSRPEVGESGSVGEATRQASSAVATADLQLLGEPRSSSAVRPDQRGITASLTRILEPVLPTAMADVVVSPLLVFELLWRAISSSGRGLVMPISLLTFFLISLLWDRRSKRSPLAS